MIFKLFSRETGRIAQFLLFFSFSELNQALFPDIAGQKQRVLVPLKTILVFKVVLGHAKNLIGP